MVAAVEDNNGRMGTEGNQKNTQTEQDEEKVDEDDDDERPCHVCGEYEADDPMCDGCDVPVHQDCYGVEEVPEGDWFCHACKGAKEGKNVEVTKLRCELCITHGVGAFTPVARSTGTVDTTAAGNRQDSAGEKGGNGNPDLKTADGGPSKKKSNSSGKSGNGNGDKWCHTACAFWVHETFFPETMHEVLGLDEVPKARRDLVCELCRRKRGAPVQCCERTCTTAFHPLCAREAQHYCRLLTLSGARIYCNRHRPDRAEWRAKKEEERAKKE
eukprot:CAMPEP_0117884252 /NCGR_PEP_ID=MMETSP0950-20121206/18749_1 /TAXON_ID=44440 /ORGANISM="Chattonella subsalsa, Strain CCMP2191" /LENGTH=270 /DNA_ID=CAMNT_0005740543 /DNA_START=30 /DNA_END=839 /DNA_ORIENTATION=-